MRKKFSTLKTKSSHATQSRVGTMVEEELQATLRAMQSPKSRAGAKIAFAASPEELGDAAVAAAKKGHW